MSDFSIVSCSLLQGRSEVRSWSFCTRNDWFIDSLRRLLKVSPASPNLQILAVQSWQQEERHPCGPDFSILARSSVLAEPAQLRQLASEIRELLAFSEAHPESVALALDGPHGKGEYVLEALRQRAVRRNPQKDSMGGEDGEGYDFLFDVLESLAAMALEAEGDGMSLVYKTERSADWD